MKINGKKIKRWAKKHKKEIIIGASAVVVVGGGIAVVYHVHNVHMLRVENRVLKDVVREQAQKMAEMKIDYHDLCMRKDAAHRALASDALRHGSSMGGEEMASWKAYMNAAGAVA